MRRAGSAAQSYLVRREGTRSQYTNARHLITIRYRSMTPDGEGGFTETWFDRPDIWAEICPIKAKQQFEYQSINVEATHLIKIAGNLDFQDNTKYVNNTWTITWSGIAGVNIQIHYQIDNGAWVEITASETNDGSYDWLIPVAAIGKRVVVRVMHLTDTTSYVLTDHYNIVAENAVDGLPNEHDQIQWTINNITRTFEILTVENFQERDIMAVITCLERRD